MNAFFLIIILFSSAVFPLRGEEFVYRHRQGEKYRILSTVREDVYLDYVLSHRAEILNRISVEVRGEKDGKGSLEAVFQTAEKAEGAGAPGTLGKSFRWSRDYESRFDRDPLGHITIDPRYFMPVVRDVPVFPGKDLKSGDTWSAPGHEMHDFRDSFGIEEPYRIPFTADYTFLGERKWKGDGKAYPAFQVSYRISEEPRAARGKIWPSRILGASDQIVYWDRELGQPRAYEEEFRMVFELSSGMTVEYRGSAEAEIVEAPAMDRERMIEDIREEIKKLGIEDAQVRLSDEGIVISLENIQFDADSALLRSSEKPKLDRIGQILLKYPGRDILVSGHTALAGTAAARAALSLERAGAVADYLIEGKIRSADRVVVKGFGAEMPLGDNATEAGRRKNRRVEITILEN